MIFTIAAGIILGVFGLIVIGMILSGLGSLIDAWNNHRDNQYLRYRQHVEEWAARIPPPDRPHENLNEYLRRHRK